MHQEETSPMAKLDASTVWCYRMITDDKIRLIQRC